MIVQADFSSKKRTCTFGLQGPWGESTSVFLRITFTFPREYPQANFPDGIPTVDLERSPLISIKQRAFILRRVRDIREKQRPCLEKCLRFLLFGDQQEDNGHHAAIDSEGSSEDEMPAARRGDPAATTLRSDKNLAEPRTSQGVFGVNGAWADHQMWLMRYTYRIRCVKVNLCASSARPRGLFAIPCERSLCHLRLILVQLTVPDSSSRQRFSRTRSND